MIIGVIYLHMCYWRQTLKVQKTYERFDWFTFPRFYMEQVCSIRIVTSHVFKARSFSWLIFHLQTFRNFIMVEFWWINFTVRRKPDSLTSNNLFIGHSRQDWFGELDWWRFVAWQETLDCSVEKMLWTE